MADKQLFIVGVPGMGNSEPSWHQRRPYGFSKNGYSKIKARSQAYRRPSTASGRLSSAPAPAFHRPFPPKALAANRSEYWGADSNKHNLASGNNGMPRGEQQHQRQQHSSRRPQGARELRVRVRPFSAGYRPACSPTHHRSSPTAAATTATAVERCTRDRAGIVRGGGRNGRAAPPPTPPPPCSPPPSNNAPGPPWSHQQWQPDASRPPGSANPRTPARYAQRRRPSTAGAMRSSTGVATEYHDQEPAKGTPAEGFAVGGAVASSAGLRDDGYYCHTDEEWCASKGGAELAVRPPRHSNGVPFVCHGRSLSPRDNSDGGEDREQRAATAGAAGMRRYPTDATSLHLDQSTGYEYDGRDERGTSGETAGLRRRPASAAPVRSRTKSVCTGGCASKGGGGTPSGGDGNYYGFDAEWGAENTTRGRQNTHGRGGGGGGGDRRVQRQRPRSASATTRGRPHVGDFGSGEPQRSFESPALGHFDGFQVSAFAARPRPRSASSTRPPVVPSFVASEKQVLRFFGHLTEELDWGCGDASSPTLKIRQVVLYLYLADGSLEICEKRQINSGQQAGLLLKRNLFKKRDGSFYGVGDLKVGSDLKLLGRSYRLTDCDDYTRRWYENQGFRQPEAQQPPKEIEECLRVEQTTGLCNKSQRPHSATSGRPPSAGGAAPENASLRRAHQQKVRRFFKHDKETLRFKAVWDDPSPGGTRRRYDLLLFLEDETVSLLNPREDHQNSGSDEGMVHVRRQRLPKDWTARSDVYSGGEGRAALEAGAGAGAHNGGGGGGGSFVGELDLAVGRTVHVWGRKMKLVGCDPFTKAYYRREHGIDMEINLDEAASGEQRRYRARRTYHPISERHHRWAEGTTAAAAAAAPTDYLTASLGKYKGAAPSGAFPMDRYRGHRIRCKAALKSNMPNDKGREFVITYDLALDTLMVFELQRRNSGRPGGLFLVKGRHRRPDKNNRYYAPQDLFLGAEVPLVTGHMLIVTEMDRSSLSLCEENPHEFPLMDFQRVLGRIAQRARNMRLDLRSELHRRAAGTTARGSGPTFLAGGGGGGGGGIAPRSSATFTSAAAAANMSWAAGSVLTNGDSHSPRQNHPGMHPAATVAARGGSNVGHGKGSGFAPTGRRVRSGATWGLVGGWGDGDYARTAQADAASDNVLDGRSTPRGGGSNSSNWKGNGINERHVPLEAQTSCMNASGIRPRGRKDGGNRKNESATYPWAAVQAAGVNVFTSNSGQAPLSAGVAGATAGIGRAAAAAAAAAAGAREAKRAGDGRHDDPAASASFQDHAAFRDAMDDLGLLVGLSQQEVLTLVRAFTDKRGKRVEWASMCDRISQIVAGVVTTVREGRHPRAGDTVGGVPVTATTPAEDTPELLHRMREAGVAWRSVFARVKEGSGRGASGSGFLGVASLVKAMRQNGLAVGAGDATLLARCFARGGGSQVDYHKLCDKIYPCDFSLPPSPTPSQTCWRGPDFCHTRHAATVADARPKIPDAAGGNGDGEAFGVAHCPALAGHGGKGGLAEGHLVYEDRRARAPTCGFDLASGGEGGGGGGGGGGGVADDVATGWGGTWSLWDRKDRHPVSYSSSFDRGNSHGSTDCGGGKGDGGSSQCWDEENAVF